MGTSLGKSHSEMQVSEMKILRFSFENIPILCLIKANGRVQPKNIHYLLFLSSFHE